jgi:hypothetical protein
MIELSNLEKNLQNKLRIKNLKSRVDNWSPRNCQFTSVKEVNFESLYLFTGMSY